MGMLYDSSTRPETDKERRKREKEEDKRRRKEAEEKRKQREAKNKVKEAFIGWYPVERFHNFLKAWMWSW